MGWKLEGEAVMDEVDGMDGMDVVDGSERGEGLAWRG